MTAFLKSGTTTSVKRTAKCAHCAFIFLMAFPLCAAARVDGPGPPPIVLDEHFKVKPIFPVMEVIEDRSGNLTLDEVTTGAMSSRFVKLPGNPPNPGFSTSVFWLRFAVKNEAGRQLNGCCRLRKHGRNEWSSLFRRERVSDRS